MLALRGDFLSLEISGKQIAATVSYLRERLDFVPPPTSLISSGAIPLLFFHFRKLHFPAASSPFYLSPKFAAFGHKTFVGDPAGRQVVEFPSFPPHFLRTFMGRKDGVEKVHFPSPSSSCNFPNKPWKKRKEGENIR